MPNQTICACAGVSQGNRVTYICQFGLPTIENIKFCSVIVKLKSQVTGEMSWSRSSYSLGWIVLIQIIVHAQVFEENGKHDIAL